VTDGAQLWIPFHAQTGFAFDDRGSRGFSSVARLKPGVSQAQAQADLSHIAQQLEVTYPATNAKRGVEVSPLEVETFSQLRPIAMSLMVAVGFVLLLACANVANLMIGRADVRQKEIALRAALGAGRRRLVRQLLTESCVLTAAGALAGLAVAQIAIRAALAASPVTLPSFLHPQLRLAVIAFAGGLALACGLVLGLAPAFRYRGQQLSQTLNDAARGSSGARSQRLRAALVVAEVALAIVLLTGAGLMIRSVQKLTAIDPGFDAHGLLTLDVSVPQRPAPAATPPAGPPAPPSFVVSADELQQRLRAVPGVSAASLASDVPLDGNSSAVFYGAEGDTTTDAQTRPRAYFHRVTPDFFDTMRMPVLAGRTFEPAERGAGNTAVIVSENVAKRFWPGQSPLGKRIKFGGVTSANPWLTIVGVVPDVKYRGLPDNPTRDPDLYLPYADRAVNAVVLRTSGDPAALTAGVQSALRAATSSIIVFNVSPITNVV
jgi:predicted permease